MLYQNSPVKPYGGKLCIHYLHLIYFPEISYFYHFFQVKAITKHYNKKDTDALMATDYLCLGSGHDDMAETLSQYFEIKFKYEIDVVSLMSYIKLLYLSKKCKHLSVYYYLDNVFFCFKGTTKSLNSIFLNFWQMVYGWPDGHTFKHLKRQILFNLIEHWETYATKLQQHLDKQPLSYKEALLQISNHDQNEPIPTALGDFVLAAISLTTGILICPVAWYLYAECSVLIVTYQVSCSDHR